MKKLFYENKALAYIYLSFISMIALEIPYLFALEFLSLPQSAILLPLAGMVFGVLGITHRKGTLKPVSNMIFALIGFLFNTVLLLFILFVNYKVNFWLETAAMPVEGERVLLQIPILLPIAGIIFGIFVINHRRETSKPGGNIIFAVICVLSNAALLLFMLFMLFIGYGTDFPMYATTAIAVEEVWKRDLKLDDGGVVVGSFCVADRNSPGGLVDIFDSTKIYEKYGWWPWQIRRVGMDAIQPGQIVDIQSTYVFGDMVDDEISDLLYNPAYLTSNLVGAATQITIRSDEYAPYEFNEYQIKNCDRYHLKP